MEVKKAEILAEVKMMIMKIENKAPRLQVLYKTVDNKISSLGVHFSGSAEKGVKEVGAGSSEEKYQGVGIVTPPKCQGVAMAFNQIKYNNGAPPKCINGIMKYQGVTICYWYSKPKMYQLYSTKM